MAGGGAPCPARKRKSAPTCLAGRLLPPGCQGCSPAMAVAGQTSERTMKHHASARARHPDAPSYVPTHLIETRAEHLLTESSRTATSSRTARAVSASRSSSCWSRFTSRNLTRSPPMAPPGDLEATNDAEPDDYSESSLGWPERNAIVPAQVMIGRRTSLCRRRRSRPRVRGIGRRLLRGGSTDEQAETFPQALSVR